MNICISFMDAFSATGADGLRVRSCNSDGEMVVSPTKIGKSNADPERCIYKIDTGLNVWDWDSTLSVKAEEVATSGYVISFQNKEDFKNFEAYLERAEQ